MRRGPARGRVTCWRQFLSPAQIGNRRLLSGPGWDQSGLGGALEVGAHWSAGVACDWQTGSLPAGQADTKTTTATTTEAKINARKPRRSGDRRNCRRRCLSPPERPALSVTRRASSIIYLFGLSIRKTEREWHFIQSSRRSRAGVKAPGTETAIREREGTKRTCSVRTTAASRLVCMRATRPIVARANSGPFRLAAPF